MSDELRWVYGYGATKHIEDPTAKDARQRGIPYALCGVPGGFPREEPERPVCKRCAAKAARLSVPQDGQQ